MKIVQRIRNVLTITCQDVNFLSASNIEVYVKQDGFFAAFSDALAKNVKNMRKNKESDSVTPSLPKPDEDSDNAQSENTDERNTESK